MNLSFSNAINTKDFKHGFVYSNDLIYKVTKFTKIIK